MFKSKIRDEAGFQIIINGILVLVLIVILLPLWRVLMTSLTPLDIYNKVGTPLFMWPWDWSLAAYKQMLQQQLFVGAAINSAVITISGTLLSLLLTIPLAYLLSVRTLPGRNLITTLILFTFLFNPGLIPNYLLVTKLGLQNSFLAIILPPAVSVYNTLVMRAFFEGIPDEIKEAARLDGANDLQILWKVVLPLSVPIVLTVGMFYAVWFWNEFFTPIIYLNDLNMQPLPVLLRNILMSARLNEYLEYDAYTVSPVPTLQSAAVLLTMLPMVVLYPWIQRYFTKGALIGAVKE
jgi:putative aldouronate transport system permease protein